MGDLTVTIESNSHKRWLTPKAAAEYCSIHPNTLANWEKKGLVNPSRNGRVVRYDRLELDRLLSAEADEQAA